MAGLPKSLVLVAALMTVVGAMHVPQDYAKQTTTAPNVVVMMIDDLGWQDVGFRGNTDLSQATPFIDKLAAEGVKFENHFVQPACTPTRGSFLTGRYAFRLGFQRGVIGIQSDDGLEMDERTLAEELKNVGYRCGIFGKWHLGNADWNMLPLQRGFDEYLGIYGGQLDFWTKKTGAFYDLHLQNGDETDQNSLSTKVYSQYVYQEGVERFLRNHATNHQDTPFFLYHAMQTTHSPMQAPDDLELNPACNRITDETRRIFCAMVLVTDSMVAETVSILQETGLDKNTLLLFSADNGGNPTYGGYNMPLRGRKGSAFEGGVRSASFIWGDLLPQHVQGTTYTGLIHISDWLPTFMGLATGGTWTPKDLPKPIDGLDVWSAVTNNRESPRSELVHNLDTSENWPSAIRVGKYKLITGQRHEEWFPTPDMEAPKVNLSLSAGVQCSGEGRSQKCSFLFDMDSDPDETTNLYSRMPTIVQSLQKRLDEFKSGEAECRTCGATDPAAAVAARATGYWRPWLGNPPKPSNVSRIQI